MGPVVTVGRIWTLLTEEWTKADPWVQDGPYWSRCEASQVLPRRGEVVQGREAAQLPRKTRQGWGIPSRCPPPFAAHPLLRQKPSAVVWDGLCMAPWVHVLDNVFPSLQVLRKGKELGDENPWNGVLGPWPQKILKPSRRTLVSALHRRMLYSEATWLAWPPLHAAICLSASLPSQGV